MRYSDITDFDVQDFEYIFDHLETSNNRYIMADHVPVLLSECIEGLITKEGGIYLDCTFGAGGHTRAMLESGEDVRVISIDRDPYTHKYAEELKEEFGDRFIYHSGKFSDLDKALEENGIDKVDGILMDLGLSSMQVDTPRRGFSFQYDGPLDMRMDGDNGINAEDFINEAKEDELAGIIFKYGDERKSRQIAAAICAERQNNRITKTKQLADIVRSAVGKYNDKIHPATRTFQAIRIHINNEINELKLALEKALRALKVEGRLAVITFHSGEDVIVKDFFREKSGAKESFSRYMPIPAHAEEKNKQIKIINKKPITAEDEEISENPRSRSAKLRIAEKLTDLVN